MSTEPEPTASRGAPRTQESIPPSIAERFAWEALREQRLARRWGIFFKCAFLLYLVALLVASMPKLGAGLGMGSKKITALVDIKGVILDGGEASADAVVKGLRDAFENKTTAGIILRINSPGGSPVQAGYINDEIFRLKHKHPRIPVYAVIEDVCASGGYYIATAADEIYADKASLVGSIGVRMDGFGFVGAIDKLGVERRLLTAGEHKGLLDPFLPQDAQEVAHVKKMLGEIHQQFINTVLKGRRDRVKNTPEIFSGLIWTGERGLELGLVDALGSASYVAREVIGAEDIVDFTSHPDVLEKFSRRFGASLMGSLRSALGSPW